MVLSMICWLWLSLIQCYVVNGKIDKPVEVFDNVLSEETLQQMHQSCVDWPGGDVVFVFPLEEPTKHSFMEQTLNSILWNLYPEATPNMYYIEYWTRQEWYHILAHADMDEGLRREQESQGRYDEPFGHPETGQVLYLKLGSRVRGPTCVFDQQTFGGDLIKSNTDSGDDNTNSTDLIIVPAVESRMLRFQGHLLHAVPRPADLWMAPTYEDQTEPVEEWGRSVLLFNTWPVARGPVREKIIRTVDSAKPSELEGTATAISKERNEWKEVGVLPSSESVSEGGENSNSNNVNNDDLFVPIQFPLMGDEKRRGTEQLSVILETPESSRQAFEQPWQPSTVVVRPVRKKKKKKKSWLSYFGVEL